MGIERSYLICGERRTGSSFLAAGLKLTGIVGTPEEYFCPQHECYWTERLRVVSRAEYLHKVLAAGTTPNGVFGSKLFWFHTDNLASKVNAPLAFALGKHDYLADAFPNLHYIFLTRRDKVRQAVSLFRAEKTETWSILGEKAPAVDQDELRASFDFMAIDERIRAVSNADSRWMQYFRERQIQPLAIVYEAMVDAYEATIREVLRWLQIAVPPDLEIARPVLQKQADAVSDEWVRRYHEIAKMSWSPTYEEPPA